jgi:hypothetical protein
MEPVMITRLGQGNAQRSSGLWDDEIDGRSPKRPHDSPIRMVSAALRLAIGVGGCLVLLWLLGAFVVRGVRGPAEGREFQKNLGAVNQRARELGGGVSNGRRAFRYRVGAWFHGKEITDHTMPEIVSIIRDCQSLGLGGAHLELDLSRTSIGDDGIKLLHAVPGLEVVSIRDTNVTKNGVDSLRSALPGTQVDAWPIYPAGAVQSEGERESKNHQPD